ncbi:hypothetical protein FDP22_14795 [Paroceanicella profunda]|uniref:DUF1772 domain-containing protein n=1 Tax=Paroceanicella profunda TaxID=2579971 RepID=A0A5B8G184_9RHOB|nr:hypothetical protein [Paroceanicella profunda]QDL92939.1 hypothetical protein FDP22_14795 [Paroceanicella profunda]
MNGFLEVLQKVGATQASWAIIVIALLWGCASLYRMLVCPIANCRPVTLDLPPEEAERQINQRVRHPLSFLVLMLLGIGLSVSGLFGLASDTHRGTIAFFMLVVGLFLILTLPMRQNIRDGELRVMAARDLQARQLMSSSLRHDHRQLLYYEFGGLSLLTLTVLLF